MSFENRNRRRNVELICECREVRSDRFNNDRFNNDRFNNDLRDRNRNRDDRCRCKESHRRHCNFGF
jgi:hypothetical protein